MVNRRLRSAGRAIKPDGVVFHAIASILKAVGGLVPGTVYFSPRKGTGSGDAGASGKK
jgi:hypothetical protein